MFLRGWVARWARDGRHVAALSRYEEGANLQRAGQDALARKCFEKAIELEPDFFDALRDLSVACANQGDLRQAEHFCRRALEVDQASVEMRLHLGNLLRSARRHEDALAAYHQAARLQPDDPRGHNNLGNSFMDLGRLEEAVDAFRRAIALAPGFGEAHFNLGLALQKRGDLTQARTQYQAALECKPELADAHLNLGFLSQGEGDSGAAIEHYARAIRARPESADAHFNYGMQLLLTGDFRRGWEEYEWRRRLPAWRDRTSYADRPLWDLSRGRSETVLLFGEQGFGDTLQFFRYARLVAERVERAIVECTPELKSLLINTPGVAAVLAKGDRLPHFDSCVPLMSLPRIFGTGVDTVPAAVPYVFVDPAKLRTWRERLAGAIGALKVGLCWKTDAATGIAPLKSVPVDVMAPLAAIQGVSFYALKKRNPAAQPEQPPGMALTDLSAHIEDFSDTAAIIANLDLVISIDTAVAHLAGALGKPVWTLAHFPPDWRWLTEREDSPWYPTMRLFRQQRRGEWGPVVGRVAEALRAWAHNARP